MKASTNYFLNHGKEILKVAFLLLSIWIFFGCHSVKKSQHSESSETHSAVIDTTKTTVKASTDTTSKIVTVKKEGTTVKITNPVFNKPDTTKPATSIHFPPLDSGLWTNLFESLASADGIEINQESSDSTHAENSGSKNYDSTSQKGQAATADKKDATADASKKASGFSWWLLLWLVPLLAGLAWYKRGWIIAQVVKLTT